MEQSGGILSKIGRSKGARVKDVRRIDLTTTPYSIFTFIKIGGYFTAYHKFDRSPDTQLITISLIFCFLSCYSKFNNSSDFK
jgi:hypothetical protein